MQNSLSPFFQLYMTDDSNVKENTYRIGLYSRHIESQPITLQIGEASTKHSSCRLIFRRFRPRRSRDFSGIGSWLCITLASENSLLKNSLATGRNGNQRRNRAHKASIFSVSTGNSCFKSATAKTSATSPMGASRSVFIATTNSDFFIPARCCTAPEIPQAT